MHDAIIQAEGLVKSFAGKVRALDSLTLTVQQGGIHGLLGPNGAAKTTLIRILATLLPPDAGTARIGGVDVRTNPAAVRARIGLAGQSAAVDDDLTGQENAEMVGRLYGLPRPQARRRAGEVLERIHLAGVADRQVKTYSGGMRPRLDLAASPVGRPQVLLLDEPTAGLDPASRHHLWPLTRNLAATGTTVLATTQYLEEADQLADPIAVINHGRLLTEGTTPQLKDRVGGAAVQLRVPAADRARTLAALRDGNGEDPAVDEHDGRMVLPGAGRRQDPDGGAAPPGDRRHHPGGRGAAQADPRRGVPRTDRPPRHPRRQRQHPRPSRRRRRQRPGPTRGASPMSATTTTRPLGLGRTVSDIAVIVRRDLVRSLRLPDVLVTSTVMPVIFILMFTYVFGGAIQMAEDLATGVIDRHRSLPMASSALPAGRTLADTCGMLRTMALLLAVGLAIGVRWQTSPWRLLAGVAIALARVRPRLVVGHGSPRPGRAHPRGGPGGQLHGRVPAGVHQLDVRPHPDHARMAASVRRPPARHRDHQRPARPAPRPRRPPARPDRHRPGRAGPGLVRSHHRGLRPPGRPPVPPHRQLTVHLRQGAPGHGGRAVQPGGGHGGGQADLRRSARLTRSTKR